MKNLLRWLPCFLAVAALASDQPKNEYTQEQLRPFLEAQAWTVYSLDPARLEEGEPLRDPFATPVTGAKAADAAPSQTKHKAPPDQVFHDYMILGQHTLPMTPEMKLVIQDLDRAGQLWCGSDPLCYFPRHGIRVVESGSVYDLQICYQCFTAVLYVGAEQVGVIHFAGKGMNSPQAPNPNALNVILKKAGIKRPPSQG